jgi:hypothetical protein
MACLTVGTINSRRQAGRQADADAAAFHDEAARKLASLSTKVQRLPSAVLERVRPVQLRVQHRTGPDFTLTFAIASANVLLIACEGTALHCTLHRTARTARTMLSGAIHYWPQRRRPICNCPEEEIYLDIMSVRGITAFVHVSLTQSGGDARLIRSTVQMVRL